MTEPVMLFPNVLQPAIALKAYAPMGVKFWQSEETVLDGMREFADGWFARRHTGTRAALEAARRMGEAATPLDALREYQDWLAGAMSRLLEDGMACQQQVLKAGTNLNPSLPSGDAGIAAEPVFKPEERQSA
jgi:hypothetical protein